MMLDIGCGDNVIDDAIGLDMRKTACVDIALMLVCCLLEMVLSITFFQAI